MWPANYSTAAISMLRELARRNLNKMLADPLYPVDPSMRISLTRHGVVVCGLDASLRQQRPDRAGEDAGRPHQRPGRAPRARRRQRVDGVLLSSPPSSPSPPLP